MFKCTDCGKTVRQVSDVRDCERCGARAAQSIPSHHTDSDFLTPALIGYLVGQSFSHQANTTPSSDSSPDSFSAGGGEYSGAGATSSFDAPDSSPSSDSGSNDSGSSSSDSSSSSSSNE